MQYTELLQFTLIFSQERAVQNYDTQPKPNPHIPLNVRMDSLQPFVVILPLFMKGLDEDVCTQRNVHVSENAVKQRRPQTIIQTSYHQGQKDIY